MDHDTLEAGFFIDKGDALSGLSPSKFSSLGQLASYKTPTGHYHLKLKYPEQGGYNEWLQTSNPAQNQEVEGYVPIHTDFEESGRQ